MWGKSDVGRLSSKPMLLNVLPPRFDAAKGLQPFPVCHKLTSTRVFYN
jgi:hypothetical protein